MCGATACSTCAAKGKVDCAAGDSLAARAAKSMLWNPARPGMGAGLFGDPMRSWMPAAATMPQKALGAIPGGLTQAEWDKMSTTERQQFLALDQKNQEAVRNLLRGGLDTATALIKAGIDAAQAEAQRNHERELARIRAQAQTDLAKIQAAAGQTITAGGLTNDPTKQFQQTSTGNTALAVAVIAGVAIFAFGGKRRRR